MPGATSNDSRSVDPAVLPDRPLGRMGYAEAGDEQQREHGAVLDARASGLDHVGTILTVEHPPVITVPPRASAEGHVLADAGALGRAGVERFPTDRGGDVTYHGPGQIVVYPIVDLQRLGVKLHEYLRLLERSIIDTLDGFGVPGVRDEDATGVWVPEAGSPHRKIAAIGIRVRRWVTMHGLALNVDPDLRHFQLIVPCGLHGRPVTSMRAELGDDCPTLETVQERLVETLRAHLLG